MEKSRVTAGLQTIPRLSGVMSRKGQHAQTSCHQPGILATLGHTKHVPLLPRHSVHQGVEASLLQEDLDLPDNQIMEHLVAMVVIRHIALVEHILLSSHRDSFHLLLDLQVDLWLGYYLQDPQAHLQDMGLELPPGLAVAPKDLDHQCRMGPSNHQAKMEPLDHQTIMEASDHQGNIMALYHQAKTEALNHQGIMGVLDHLGKMGDLDYLGKVEAWDHLGIMEGLDHLGKMGDLVHQGIMAALDHLGIMAVLVYLGKTRHLDHLGKVEDLEYQGIKEDQVVTLDSVK